MYSSKIASLCAFLLLLPIFCPADAHGGFGGLRGLGFLFRAARFGRIGRGFGRGFGGRRFGGGYNNGYYNNGYYGNGYYGSNYYGSNYYGNGYNYWG